MQGRKVAVIGAGLVGVATAIALRRIGFQVEIFERRPQVTPDGSGIGITTNGVLALREIGVADEVLEAGARIERAQIRDSKDRPISDLPMRRIALGQGDYSYGFTRTRLHQRLLELAEGIPIRTGAELVDLADRGSEMVASFASGEVVAVDLVVGADGVHSAARRWLHGDMPLDNSNYVAWVAVSEHRSDRVQVGHGTQFWGRGARFSVQGMGPQQTYWWGTETIAATAAGRERKRAPVSRPGIDPEHFRGLFAGWAPEVRQLVDEYLAHTPAANVVEINPRCHRPVPTWTRGGLTLVGDAAHTMYPSLAAGASMGFEDAAVLMLCLSREPDVRAAVALYDRLRVRRSNGVLELAKKLCWLETTPNRLVVAFRDFYFRSLPSGMMADQFLDFTNFQLPREIAPEAVRRLGASEAWHWFSSQLSPLNLVVSMHLDAGRALAREDFDAALGRLQEAHEMLWLNVRAGDPDGLEYTRVRRPIGFEQLPPAQGASAVALLNRAANHAFAPDAPLARVVWVPEASGSERGRLALVCSHLACDGAGALALAEQLVQLLLEPKTPLRGESLPPPMEDMLGETVKNAGAGRRALAKMSAHTVGGMLRPGLRLVAEQPAAFEQLDSRFLRVTLGNEVGEKLMAICAELQTTPGDLVSAALVRAVCESVDPEGGAARVRVGRAYSFRPELPEGQRGTLQSYVVQLPVVYEHEAKRSLLDLALEGRARYARRVRDGFALDGVRVFHRSPPKTLREARKLGAILQKHGPMHLSVTDLSAQDWQEPARAAVRDVCVANTLSCSGSLLVVVHRVGGELCCSLGYTSPHVSEARAAKIAESLRAALEDLAAEVGTRLEPQRGDRAQVQGDRAVEPTHTAP